MKLVGSVDRFMLERVFTPFSHWFEHRTGRTNFYLAYWAFVANILPIGILFVHDIAENDFVVDLFRSRILFAFLYLAGAPWWAWMLAKTDEAVRKNPAAPIPWYFRETSQNQFARKTMLLILVFMTPISLVVWGLGLEVGEAKVRVSFHLRMVLLGGLFFVCYAYFLLVQRPPFRFTLRKEQRSLLPLSVHS